MIVENLSDPKKAIRDAVMPRGIRLPKQRYQPLANYLYIWRQVGEFRGRAPVAHTGERDPLINKRPSPFLALALTRVTDDR